MIPRDYLTVAEAAEYCGVSVSQFRAKAPVIGLRPFPFMGKLLYRVADLRLVLDTAWRQSTSAGIGPKHLLTGTHADNVRDRVIRQRGAIGENAGRAKLTTEDALTIRDSKATAKTLAAQYGVSQATIHGIRQRRSWKHLPAS